jgi:hypothetical protein
MKTQNIFAAAIGTLLLVICRSAFAQGNLTPPGAPAATMKTLDQVEARTAITNTASLVAISQPGSYYLTHNLNVTSGDAIDINTNQVTLNLNGFTISSTAPSANGSAIYLSKASGNTEVTILNGQIKSGVTNNAAGAFGGSGFANGIYYNEAGTPYNIRVSGVSATGCLSNGIVAGVNNASVVESCTVRSAGYLGIDADTVSHCSALNCGTVGIFGTVVSDSRGEEIKSDGWGIQAGTANNCNGESFGTNATGIYARSGNGCSGTSNGAGGTGLLLSAANNCTGYNSGAGGTGLSAPMANNSYGYDSGSGANGTGLDAGTAIGCTGYSSTGTAIHATIANSCIIFSGTTNILHKYNMP